MEETPKKGEHWHVQYGQEGNKKNNIIVEVLEVPEMPITTLSKYTCQHEGRECMVANMFFKEKLL